MTLQEAQAQARAEACTVEHWRDTIGHRGAPAMLAVYYGPVVVLCLAEPLMAAMEPAAFARLVQLGRRALEVSDGTAVSGHVQ